MRWRFDTLPRQYGPPVPGRLAALRVALLAVVALALAAPAADADGKVTSLRPWEAGNLYLVRTDLDGRTKPQLEPRAKVDYLREGQWVKIACQTTGESAYGSRIWDKVGNLYVPDHFVKTYTDGFIPGAPRCDAATPPPRPKPKRYVALGDSYSSGEGATGYLPARSRRPYACHRSMNAYSQVLAARHRSSVTHEPDRDFFACSGAKTGDVANEQLGALGSAVGVITISAGGNDVNFERILRMCIANVGASCQDWLDHLFDVGTLRRSLDSLYRQIRRRAPRAVVIVAGYPRLFDERRGCPIGLSGAERTLLNQAADRLNAVTASVARARGFRFADPRAAFTAHGLCSSTRWINPFVREEGGIRGSFHPNLSGQQAYADVIAAANRDVFR